MYIVHGAKRGELSRISIPPRVEIVTAHDNIVLINECTQGVIKYVCIIFLSNLFSYNFCNCALTRDFFLYVASQTNACWIICNCSLTKVPRT